MLIKYNNKTVANKVTVCDNIFSRGLGLMFRKKPLDKNEAYFFVNWFESITESAMHMFFMNFPIDFVWLDRNYKIADIRTAGPSGFFYPNTWKTYSPKKPAKYVLELPAGTAKKFGFRFGDVLQVRL